MTASLHFETFVPPSVLCVCHFIQENHVSGKLGLEAFADGAEEEIGNSFLPDTPLLYSVFHKHLVLNNIQNIIQIYRH